MAQLAALTSIRRRPFPVGIALEATRSAAARFRQPMAVSAGNFEERGFLIGSGGCKRFIPWAANVWPISASTVEGIMAPPSFSHCDVA